MDELLLPDEPPACEVTNPGGRSAAFLLCDHASHRIPARLRDLGLPQQQLREHIGWDLGILALGRALSRLLDATLVSSGYSRLVIDCNRPPGVPSSIPRESGGVIIPGNAAVTAREAERRAAACFWPYHHTITRLLDERAARGQETVLLSLHSFTPALLGQRRPWDVAILSGRDRRLAEPLLAALRADPERTVGDNQPYQVTDQGDYGIPVHGERRGLPCALVEIRQDGLLTDEGARTWAERIAAAFRRAGQPAPTSARAAACAAKTPAAGS